MSDLDYTATYDEESKTLTVKCGASTITLQERTKNIAARGKRPAYTSVVFLYNGRLSEQYWSPDVEEQKKKLGTWVIDRERMRLEELRKATIRHLIQAQHSFLDNEMKMLTVHEGENGSRTLTIELNNVTVTPSQAKAIFEALKKS